MNTNTEKLKKKNRVFIQRIQALSCMMFDDPNQQEDDFKIEIYS